MVTEFKVLGPLEVWHDGVQVPVPSGRTAVLLASLLLHANEVLSADALVDRVWDGAPANPARARATLQMTVTRLRQALGPANVVRTVAGGYQAVVPEGALDLHRFRALVGGGRFAEALALWRGEPLADLRSDALHTEVEALVEERLAALERRVEADLEEGKSAELVAELRTLVARHPLRERFWGQLMLALSRSGRQADALATYRTVAKLLDDELGVAPSKELRDIHQSVLSGEPVIAPVTAAWPTPRQLPPVTADFVGRDDVHREVGQALTGRTTASAVPITVVTGPPGSGKSALTVRIAHGLSDRFPDGQLFVNLGDGTSEPRDPAEVLVELLAAVGVPMTSVPEDIGARAAAFRSRLADRAVLVVLDGAADVEQVRHLLPGSASCAVLITSRNLLTGLEGGSVVRLRPLAAADGLQLLTRMIGAQRVSAERAAAEAIVAATGGLPLALRIVGARLATRPNLPLHLLAGRLSDEQRRLDELSTADMEVRASFELSYAALDEEVAAAFRRLGFLSTLDFAAWVVSVLTGGDGDRLVERLLEANLLEELGVDATGEPRYRLHDLLADYAAELLSPEDNAHLRHYVDALLLLADAAGSEVPLTIDAVPVAPVDVVVPELESSVVARLTERPTSWLVAEHRQFTRAIEMCATHGWPRPGMDLLELANHLDAAAIVAGDRMAGLNALLRDSAEKAGDFTLMWRAEHGRLAHIAMAGMTDELVEQFRICAEGMESCGDLLWLANHLASWAYYQSVFDDRPAVDLARRAVEIAREAGEPLTYLSALREHASMLAWADRVDEATPLFEEAAELATSISPVAEAAVQHRISVYALRHGDLERATTTSRRSLELIEAAGDLRGTAYVLSHASRVASASGDHRAAIAFAERAYRIFQSLVEGLGSANAAANLAESYLAADRAADAERLLAEAIPAHEGVGATEALERMVETLRRVRALTQDALRTGVNAR
ncbi:AfsR/SARP family transcriptional regulator [Saccharothrix variisporea]|uniref:DNA-binding SARP family transcriptional activator n=1 Tax=Saccharothrix variisporea TaxID=543527 RepID=A0A495XDP9_9PSEU|nr:BTAD domain-containing putative transcriptional regulator [Saccharothrix variisporea]RKT72152.1 DNA-binding SARP family transcriptional activator [Saccharothrix variisporea]